MPSNPARVPQKEGQDLLGKLLPLPPGEGHDLFRQSFNLVFVHPPTHSATRPRILRQEL